MLIKYSWLQTFFDTNLPTSEEIVDGLNAHIFEIEGIVGDGEETVIDVDVLPNRAYDCLSHNGIANEISAIFGIPKKVIAGQRVNRDENMTPVSAKVETDLCFRYIGVRVEGVKVSSSPEWLKKGLERLEQRSINDVVDATNYSLLMQGQPLHAFDADLVKGGITVRQAVDGETITTLDGKDIALDSTMIVIADDEGVLALAGIKGGKKAEVTETTTNLILESALFDGVSVRKTSRKVGIRTDASKRFENGLAPELAMVGMEHLVDVLVGLQPDIKTSPMTDVYRVPSKEVIVEVDVDFINQKLGILIEGSKMVSLLESISVETELEEGRLIAHIPATRLDLRIPEDIVEEVGRLYGYEAILSVPLSTRLPEQNAEVFVKTQSIRGVMLSLGFSEIYTSTFVGKGIVEVQNPLAKDRPFLRTNMSESMGEKIEFNTNHLLFDDMPVKMFEIGTVFSGAGHEEMRLCIGVGHTKAKLHNKSEDFANALEKLGVSESDVTVTKTDITSVAEMPLLKLSGGDFEMVKNFVKDEVVYQPFSSFPRIVRDIALFVPEGVEVEDVAKLLESNATELCTAGPILFDEFHKDGRVSLAFRFVFQSFEKTLSDGEANGVMEKIYEKIAENDGWEVR